MSHRRTRQALTDMICWANAEIVDFRKWLEFLYHHDQVETSLYNENCRESYRRNQVIGRLIERLRKPFDEPNEAVTWNRSEIEAELGEIADDLESALNSLDFDPD